MNKNVYVSGFIVNKYDYAFLSKYGVLQNEKIDENTVLLVLPGGADINPAIYGHKPHKSVYYHDPTDSEQIEDYRLAVTKGIPVLGICRGMQLVHALTGGKLLQHVTNHNGAFHYVVTDDGHQFKVNSIHHQMVDWRDEHHVPLAVVPDHVAGLYVSARDTPFVPNLNCVPPDTETEAAYYPQVKCIGVQFHPEWEGPGIKGGMRDTVVLWLDKYVMNKDPHKGALAFCAEGDMHAAAA